MVRILLLLGVLMQAARPPVPPGSQEAKETPKATAERTADAEETVRPPPDVRGSAGIIVFLAWMWLSILVLVVVLGWKIREVDRLHEINYFDIRPHG